MRVVDGGVHSSPSRLQVVDRFFERARAERVREVGSARHPPARRSSDQSRQCAVVEAERGRVGFGEYRFDFALPVPGEARGEKHVEEAVHHRPRRIRRVGERRPLARLGGATRRSP